MSNYVESKKQLDQIRRKDEMMFRMAISHLMDVGVRHLTEENIDHTCKDIENRDDSKSFMTNGYMCDLVRMSGELAKIPHIDLLVYIQREIEYDIYDGGISYKRAIQLLKNCMSILDFADDIDCIRSDFRDADFDDDELEFLGYGYLIEEEE